jgi:hypothetical protein
MGERDSHAGVLGAAFRRQAKGKEKGKSAPSPVREEEALLSWGPVRSSWPEP